MGGAKRAMEMAVEHVKRRRQFGRSISEFHLVKEKIARMAELCYAMDAMTYMAAGLVDRKEKDIMLETAITKLFTSEMSWQVVDDALQLWAGEGYMREHGLERMLRDARINQIGEGANDVLRSFIALVGMRGPGEELRTISGMFGHPGRSLRSLWGLVRVHTSDRFRRPQPWVQDQRLYGPAWELTRLVRRFHRAVLKVLVRHREEVLDRQYDQERIAEAAMELYASLCVLSRLDAELSGHVARNPPPSLDAEAGMLFLSYSARRIRRQLAALGDNDDSLATLLANRALGT
jgi:hypothetical protein